MNERLIHCQKTEPKPKSRFLAQNRSETDRP